jgi:hypothetical protein
MTYPDSQPNTEGTFDEKIARAEQLDPLAQVEADYRAGWPDRWPNVTAPDADNDAS